MTEQCNHADMYGPLWDENGHCMNCYTKDVRPKQLSPRDFAGALGHAETAIKFAIQYLEKQNYFDAMRVLKDAEKKINLLAPMDDLRRT